MFQFVHIYCTVHCFIVDKLFSKIVLNDQSYIGTEIPGRDWCSNIAKQPVGDNDTVLIRLQ